MRLAWLPFVGLVAACYRPSVDERACHVRCAYDPLTQAVGGCPAGLLCDLGTCKTNLGDICMIDAGVDDAPLHDGARDMAIVDVPVDAPLPNCYGSGLITICLASQPVAPFAPGSTIINTSNPNHCTPWSHTTSSANEVCLIAASSVTIAAGVNLVVHGARPLVIVSDGAITVAGTIDASGSFPAPAAGAPNWQCAAGTAPSDLGGGAGGSFVTLGGAGGNSLQVSTGGVPGGIDQVIGEVRAGCGGQTGSSTGPLGVGGGAGGGAIYLIAKTQLSLDTAALIDASGAPGKGGGLSTGGGAGGSGGMIGLDAPVIQMSSTAKLLANGGGGGCGGTTTSSGGNGQSVTTPHLAAGGCVSAGGAGSGGDGGYDLVNAVAGGSVVSVANNGGGGGGGGAGVIVVYPDSQRAALGNMPSPLPTSPMPP